MAPSWTPDQKGVKVQIVDVFALRLATGYEKDPAGRLLLQSEESIAQGRTWSLAKACQLVRNDAQPHRWVVLHRHKKAWGLFWVGGGLDLCRDHLQRLLGTEPISAIVPATSDTLLKIVLSMDDLDESPLLQELRPKSRKKPQSSTDHFPWKAVAITSIAWLIVIGGIASYSAFAMQRQSNLIQQLIKANK